VKIFKYLDLNIRADSSCPPPQTVLLSYGYGSVVIQLYAGECTQV